MKNLRDLIKEMMPVPMTEQQLADSERMLLRFFELLYEMKVEQGGRNVK